MNVDRGVIEFNIYFSPLDIRSFHEAVVDIHCYTVNY